LQSLLSERGIPRLISAPVNEGVKPEGKQLVEKKPLAMMNGRMAK